MEDTDLRMLQVNLQLAKIANSPDKKFRSPTLGYRLGDFINDFIPPFH